MSITLSSITRTQFDQTFLALDGMLAKAEAHAASAEIEESVYLAWRLTPDMLPLSRQIQLVSDFSVRGMSRLAGVEPPSMPDDEVSFSALRARLQTARSAINDLDTDAVDADPEGPVSFPAGPMGEMTLPRQAYVQNFVLANVLFHASIAYGILRSLGVALGKLDFLAVSG
jgi:hypothetical protein